MRFKELLLKQASGFGQKPAIIFNDTPIPFAVLKDNSFKIANHLKACGINTQDKVAVYLPNTPEAVFSFLGTMSIGGVLVPFDFMLTQAELITLINHSECKLLIALPKKDIDLKALKENCPTLKTIITVRGDCPNCTAFDSILKEASPNEPTADFKEEDLASIFYTSGSTGHPKGVMLSYKHFDNPVRCIDYYLHLSDEDTILCPGMPFSHLGGLDYILLMLHFAQTLVLMERFNPLEFLKNVGKHKVKLTWMVPPLYVAILSLKEYDKFDLSSLRYVDVFGAPSSPYLLKKFHQICPNAHLINGWGMTETAAPNCFLPPGVEKIESVGKFPPGMETKIVDDNGNARGPNEEGELWVKGEAVMLGYYKEDELTKEVVTASGWLKTGDIAKYDDDGLFYIVGRKKDMIKVAGEIVFSAEVEEKIHLHPKIQEAAVIGVPDKLRGEVPKAFISLKEGESVPEGDLKIFLKEHLASFKIPHYFEFVSQIPKNRAGKIDKQALKRVATST